MIDDEILAAVAAEAGWMEQLLVRLVEAPTVLGNEEPGQAVMAEALLELDLVPRDVPMDADVLRRHLLASPFSWDVSGKRNVVATWGQGSGRSLVLNGHIDVVSPEPVELWTSAPFVARREDDWLYGRGAGDMKSGLAAMLGAVRGLQRLGLSPAGRVELQSVVEEECTGNGALAVALAAPRSDAAVVIEPFGDAIAVAQLGVLWFHVRVLGTPAHVGEAGLGVNAIEKTFPLVSALRALESELNASPPPPFDVYEHPVNLNVGVIRGGDWPSTVAAECRTSCRLALYPGERPAELFARVREVVSEAAARDAFLASRPPVVEEDGFACDAYKIDPESELVQTLAAAHERRAGAPPQLIATTATTDARIFGLLGMPATCLGPYSEREHAADERVWLPSVAATAQTLALFLRDWCGLEG